MDYTVILVDLGIEGGAFLTSTPLKAELVRGRRGMTPETALRLAKFFGNSAEFWTGLQLSVDLYRAQKREAATLKKIHRYKKALA